jgi:hypothetical protein
MVCNQNLKIFVATRPNFNYFGHFYNYDVIIQNFILLVVWILGLFSSIIKLICPIAHNSHQISYTLKVFYGDIGVYFYVCTIIMCVCVCTLNMHMYVYCSYNESQN